MISNMELALTFAGALFGASVTAVVVIVVFGKLLDRARMLKNHLNAARLEAERLEAFVYKRMRAEIDKMNPASVFLCPVDGCNGRVVIVGEVKQWIGVCSNGHKLQYGVNGLESIMAYACPRDGCKGTVARGRGTRPWSFICSECHDLTTTEVAEMLENSFRVELEKQS